MGKPISPAVHLALGMHSQPGVYAVLLGSGVSTGAGMLTGWGVVKDLVRQLAGATPSADEETKTLAATDPEAWWAERGDGELGYSTLLEEVAPTAAARQGILAAYFEPSESEREEGLKAPSEAHRALAELVKRGTVRVIVTTNFDRLMEQALEAVGVSPQVISRPEAVRGMAPLAHAEATVIKLHGDYKDLGTLNTPSELTTYPSEWTTLLAQVFDEYGLLIAGWSADWDAALVAAIEQAPSRRYPLYWDGRSSKGAAAQRLLQNRHGQVIPSDGADGLFKELLGSVEALDRLAEPPLTTAMRIAMAKRFLPDPVRRIDFHDLVMGAVDGVADEIAKPRTFASDFGGADFEALYLEYLEASRPLLDLLLVCLWHDTDGIHKQLWRDVLQRLMDAAAASSASHDQLTQSSRLYPALFVLGVAGAAISHRGGESLFLTLSTEVKGPPTFSGQRRVAAQTLDPGALITDGQIRSMPRNAAQGWLFPVSHTLRSDLREVFNKAIPLDEDFSAAFDGFEYRLGLIQQLLRASTYSGPRALDGEYVHDNRWTWEDDPTLTAEDRFREQAGSRSDWPWTDLLGGTEKFDRALTEHRKILTRYRKPS